MNLSNREAIAVYTLLESLKELHGSRAIIAKTTAALNEAVRAIEEDAPHEPSCRYEIADEFLKRNSMAPDCTCWKQTALARINELMK